MRSLVTSHPGIAIAPETHFLNQCVAASNDSSFGKLWEQYARTHRFKELGLDADLMKQRIVESEDFSIRNMFQMMLKEYARTQGKGRWGEKTPSHYAYLKELLIWFPNARVIWVIRDPRAICSSLLSVWWRRWEARGLRGLEGTRLTRCRRIYFDARVWRRHLSLLRTTWLDDERVKCVQYEDIVCNPATMLRDIGDFLNEEFPDHIVNSRLWSDVSTVAPELLSGPRGYWLRTHFQEAIKPITKEHIDKWRAKLTRSEIEIIENVCREGMEWLGYQEMKYPRPSDAVDRIMSTAARYWGFTFWAIHETSRR